MKINCSVCEWESQDLSEAFAAVLSQQLATHCQVQHPPAAVAQPTKLKFDPPKVGLDYNPEQWSSFKRQWEMYKVGMAIPANMMSTSLFHCCSEELRADILRDIREDISTMSEADLLKSIKRLAVKEKGVLAQRLELARMTQTPGTGILHFAKKQTVIMNMILVMK